MPPKGKVYPLSIPEQKATEEYIQEALKQRFIRPSTFPAASSFSFVAKKDGVVAQDQGVFSEGKSILHDQGRAAMPSCLGHVEETLVPRPEPSAGGFLSTRNAFDGCFPHGMGGGHEWPLGESIIGVERPLISHAGTRERLERKLDAEEENRWIRALIFELFCAVAVATLRGARIFSKLDLRSAYYLIRIRDVDECKMKFITPAGHYEYQVMPYGLSNSPSVFQGYMNEVFLKKLREHHLYLKSSKPPAPNMLRREVLRDGCMYHPPAICPSWALSSGHPGSQRTLSLLQDCYWRPNMAQDISRYIRGCSVCAITTTPRKLPEGQLVPLPILRCPWSHLDIDFMTDLSPSNHHTCVFVVIDRFSKACKLIPIKGLPTVFEAAELLFQQMFHH
ncbi:hypothetical protein PO909_032451 [Leuciscus waleckii]